MLSRKQLEIYSELIKDYDKKLKQIIIENNDIKSLILSVLSELDLIIQNSMPKKSEIFKKDYHKLINSPFDDIFQNLNNEIQSKIEFLKMISKDNHDSLMTTDNITISSIDNLSEVLNKTLNNSDNAVYEISGNKTKLEFNQSKLILNNASISSSSLSSSNSTSTSTRI